MAAAEIRVFDCQQGEISGKSFAVIVSRYHASLTSKLLGGALETLAEAGVPNEQICIAHVPGAWELAAAAARMIEQFDAVVCLGAVIKGETTHDQYINATVSQALGKLAVDHRKPVGFGLLTCNTMEQAIARCGGSVGNKGEEAATAAIQMLQLFGQL